jgi:hypothetical protein
MLMERTFLLMYNLFVNFPVIRLSMDSFLLAFFSQIYVCEIH